MLGCLLGALPVLLLFAPAAWLAAGVERASGGQILFAQPRGTVWTGSAAYGTRNDIAVAWPAQDEPPLVLAVLSMRAEPDAEHDDELIAEAARLVVGALG